MPNDDRKNSDIRLLRGPPASMLQTVVFASAIACFGAFFAGVVAVLVHAPHSVLVWCPPIMLGAALLTGAAAGIWGLQIKRESRSGYTTLEGRLRHLPQVDPRTGALIRPAGDRFRTKGRELE